MEKQVIVGIILIVLIGVFISIAVGPVTASKMVIYEWQVTDEVASQLNPDVWGNRIVWQDDRNGNWDIYMFTDTSTFYPETQITSHPSNQLNPAIYGDRIVYNADTNYNWDIFMYDLVNQTETQITNNTAIQQFPDIYDNRIVWEDNRNGNWDIYLYDLVNGTERRLTWSGKNTNPAIYGDRVVYLKDDIQVHMIYLPTGVDTHIATVELTLSINNKNLIINPTIYDGFIAFAEGHKYPCAYPRLWCIEFTTQLYDVSSNRIIWTSYTDSWAEDNPDIDGEYIVWQTDRDGNWEIYLYDYRTAFNTRVTNNGATQINPKVFNPYIVWQDWRNGNWDIYAGKIGFVSDTPIPIEPSVSPVTPDTSPGSGAVADVGTLYVASYPSNATIFINGTERGHTDQLVSNVTAGLQNLTLIKDGYQPYTTVVNIPAGDVKVLAPITLMKGGPSPGGTGTLYVASYPTGATILINGTDYGKTDQFVKNVPSGNQNLTLTKEGYQLYTATVNVPAGDLKVLAPITLSLSQSVVGLLGECPCGEVTICDYSHESMDCHKSCAICPT